MIHLAISTIHPLHVAYHFNSVFANFMSLLLAHCLDLCALSLTNFHSLSITTQNVNVSINMWIFLGNKIKSLDIFKIGLATLQLPLVENYWSTLLRWQLFNFYKKILNHGRIKDSQETGS